MSLAIRPPAPSASFLQSLIPPQPDNPLERQAVPHFETGRSWLGVYNNVRLSSPERAVYLKVKGGEVVLDLQAIKASPVKPVWLWRDLSASWTSLRLLASAADQGA